MSARDQVPTAAEAAKGPAIMVPVGPLGPKATLHDRVSMELQPVLAGLAMLTNAVRVLKAFRDATTVSPELHQVLATACPTWCDPLAHAGELSADSVVCELARYAGELCTHLCVADAQSGDECCPVGGGA